MEDEQHVLLHCPHYVPLRADLFEEVLRLTSVKDTCGRTVLSSTPAAREVTRKRLTIESRERQRHKALKTKGFPTVGA